MMVSYFIQKEVPPNLLSKFIKEMRKWDSSLEGLRYSEWPSYDEDVLENMLKYAKEKN